MTQVMDVIVVGCGASGLAALRRLHDAGLKVMGLEAADRIGGRINTVQFAGTNIDIGAAWCHGEKDNVVFELANPHGLLGRPKPDHKFYVQSSGDLVPNDVAEEILKTLDDAVGAADKNTTESIEECVKKAAKSNTKLKQSVTEPFVEWFTRNSHLGGQTDPKLGKSLKGLVEFHPSEGEFMLNWQDRGYKSILDVLLNKYPDPSKELPITILTNKEVEMIKWKAICPEFDPNSKLVQIKCKDRSLYCARSVLVTVSIGVLKERHQELFCPSLPENKISAINTLQMCILDKIYVEFTKPWWPETPANITILWRDEDKKKFTSEESWITEIYGFLTVEHQPNVLLAWIYGEGAKKMEQVSEEKVKEGLKKLLDIVFSKQFKPTPIKDLIRTKWASNRLTRGTYAYRSVATEEAGEGAKTLSEPLFHGDFPVVCFAGEASSHHHHSAVHGAVEAGFREADRLIKHFRGLTQ